MSIMQRPDGHSYAADVSKAWFRKRWNAIVWRDDGKLVWSDDGHPDRETALRKARQTGMRFLQHYQQFGRCASEG